MKKHLTIGMLTLLAIPGCGANLTTNDTEPKGTMTVLTADGPMGPDWKEVTQGVFVKRNGEATQVFTRGIPGARWRIAETKTLIANARSEGEQRHYERRLKHQEEQLAMLLTREESIKAQGSGSMTSYYCRMAVSAWPTTSSPGAKASSNATCDNGASVLAEALAEINGYTTWDSQTGPGYASASMTRYGSPSCTSSGYASGGGISYSDSNGSCQ